MAPREFYQRRKCQSCNGVYCKVSEQSQSVSRPSLILLQSATHIDQLGATIQHCTWCRISCLALAGQNHWPSGDNAGRCCSSCKLLAAAPGQSGQPGFDRQVPLPTGTLLACPILSASDTCTLSMLCSAVESMTMILMDIAGVSKAWGHLRHSRRCENCRQEHHQDFYQQSVQC